MAVYNDQCRLKGYEDTKDWYLAWETYKYLYRNENLSREDKYNELLKVVEEIVVMHMCSNNPKSKYEDILEFYRFYITLAKNEDDRNFVLTEDVDKYLRFVKKEREEHVVKRILQFVFEE